MKSVFYQAVYRLLGSVFMLAAAVTFLLMFGLFAGLADSIGADDTHVFQEIGCVLAFMGLVIWWLSFNLQHGRFLHLALLIFFALLAGVHWVDFFQGHLTLSSPLINTVPALFFAVMYYYYDFDKSEWN